MSLKTEVADKALKASPQKTFPKILLNRGKSCDIIDLSNNYVSIDNRKKVILPSTKEEQQKAENSSLKPSPTKEQLPSVVAGRHRENLAFYTPRARRSILNDETIQKELVNEGMF